MRVERGTARIKRRENMIAFKKAQHDRQLREAATGTVTYPKGAGDHNDRWKPKPAPAWGILDLRYGEGFMLFKADARDSGSPRMGRPIESTQWFATFVRALDFGIKVYG